MDEQQKTRAERKAEKKANRKKKSLAREILEWVVTIAVAVVLALCIRTFVFEPVRVDGASMNNTLLNGEYMIATKWDYLFGDPDRFDVVICHYPNRGRENFVKRVVGLPGETIELREGELYVNGEFVAQDFDRTPSRRDFGPYTVPEGRYFVMGDNRDNSHDSRSINEADTRNYVGALERDMIKGHVRCVVLPIKNMRMIDTADSGNDS